MSFRSLIQVGPHLPHELSLLQIAQSLLHLVTGRIKSLFLPALQDVVHMEEIIVGTVFQLDVAVLFQIVLRILEFARQLGQPRCCW